MRKFSVSKIFGKKNKGGQGLDPALHPDDAVAQAKAVLAQYADPSVAGMPVAQAVPADLAQPVAEAPLTAPSPVPEADETSVPPVSMKSSKCSEEKELASAKGSTRSMRSKKSKSSNRSRSSNHEARGDEDENKSRRSNKSDKRDDIVDDEEEDRDGDDIDLDQIISADSNDDNDTMGTATSDDEENAVSFDEEDPTQHLSTAVSSTTTFENQSQSSFDGSVAASEAVGDQKKFFHKDVVLHNFGDTGNPNLVIRAMYFVPKPKTPDDIVVRIEASTVSARDCMHRRGIGIDKSRLPFVPGFEIIGTVQTLGDRARAEGQFHEGDRVAGLAAFGGGNSRFISLPSSRLVQIPSTIKSTNAVCLINDYMAAFQALRVAKKSGSPFTGRKILVTDGFSPVGQAVIKLASLEGADVYCTADESKHQYLATLGATCFQTDPQTWLPAMSGTFDVVIDNLCVDGYNSSWFALNPNGALVCMSPVYSFEENYEGRCASFGDFRELQGKWATMKAKYILSQTSFYDVQKECDDHPDQYRQDLRYLCFLLQKGEITPKIAEKVSLEDVPDAQRLLETGKANGTIVCVPWKED